jgi:hypothetical protein
MVSIIRAQSDDCQAKQPQSNSGDDDNAGDSHHAASSDLAPKISGRRSWRETTPSVAKSIFIAVSGETLLRPFSNKNMPGCEIPDFSANAFCVPPQWLIAFSMRSACSMCATYKQTYKFVNKQTYGYVRLLLC